MLWAISSPHSSLHSSLLPLKNSCSHQRKPFPESPPQTAMCLGGCEHSPSSLSPATLPAGAESLHSHSSLGRITRASEHFAWPLRPHYHIQLINPALPRAVCQHHRSRGKKGKKVVFLLKLAAERAVECEGTRCSSSEINTDKE